MTFGHGQGDFLANSSAAVAQLVLMRLRLWTGEWFLNLADGTPWTTQVLGTGTRSLLDAAIRSRIINTPGVLGIASYSSNINTASRVLTVNVTVNTIYSSNVLEQLTSVTALPSGGTVTFGVLA